MRSGGVLLATFIGGVGFFFGPVLGAIVFTFFVVWVANVTKAWLLYLGLFFVAMVLFAPGGLASIVVANLQVAKAGRLARLLPAYAVLAGAGVAALAGFVALVEMLYHLELEAVNNPVLKLAGLALNVRTAPPWIAAAAVLAAGSALYWLAWRRVRARWDEVHA
jgi:branched-chain amino acid transport system permease protein